MNTITLTKQTENNQTVKYIFFMDIPGADIGQGTVVFNKNENIITLEQDNTHPFFLNNHPLIHNLQEKFMQINNTLSIFPDSIDTVF